MGYYDRYSGRGRTPQKTQQEQRRSGVLRTVFSPQLGASMRPLKETGRMFINMVAMIFAQVGLIDPRHPSVTNVGGRKYGLFEVIMLAYQRLEWRQDKFLQCSVFVAVMSCIVICAVAVTYAAFTLLFQIA